MKKSSLSKHISVTLSSPKMWLIILAGTFGVVFASLKYYDYKSNVLSVTTGGDTGQTTPYSLVLNQLNPKIYDEINFTVTYPKEADKRIGKQQMYQPTTAIDCFQNGVQVYNRRVLIASKVQNGDGTITGITYPTTLGGGPVNGMVWTSGPATCSAYTYYFTTKQLISHVVAQIYFDVAGQ